jgi:3',5'-nucleoside bisphosphate phosphatase
MKSFKADLHVHTVLSPCASLDMSPVNIINAAAESHIDILGITDHNSTYHCQLAVKLAESKDIMVMMGAEITTKEEVHCLAFFENNKQLSEFQEYIDQHLPVIINNPETFGYQLVVDAEENIIREENRLLISALNVSIEEIECKVHELDGLFIPAHVDKSRFSLFSQLGFIPAGLKIDAFEVVDHIKFAELYPAIGNRKYSTIRNSDAHTLKEIGQRYSVLELEEKSFNCVCEAINKNSLVN